MADDEHVLLAAELVLGLLDMSERSDALELLATDASFAAEVRRWEALLTPLFAGFEPREPSRDLYPEIRARLDRIERRRVDEPSAAALSAANENEPRGVAPGWRWATFGSAAAAAVLAGILLLSPVGGPGPAGPGQDLPAVADAQPEPRQMVVAQLSGEEGGPVMVASAEQGQPTLRVRLIDETVDGGEPSNMVPVLWVIAGDQAPQAIGALPRLLQNGQEQVSQIALRQALVDLIASGATLAVTYEPADEATYEAPTTPIVASGTLSQI